ncbi:unnamed protein product [Paramecium primaurelia]|uniref:VLRF1 domain-containing protein n=1 Tax=Paramecium primaurelia TaxID=5886 RepID=A0A8S1K0T8_PARPR|nr:unnamed protein product [Paramecium primaurelia]
MITNIFNQPEISKTIISNLNTKDLANLSRCNKYFKQQLNFILKKHLEQRLVHFLNSLRDIYNFRKKTIPMLPKDLYKVPKNMEIKIKDQGVQIIKIQLKDLPKQFLTLNWQSVNINSILPEDSKLSTQDNKAFKYNENYIIINRSLIDQGLNYEFLEINEDCSKEILEKIAQSSEFANYQLNDMQSILSRQKEILERVHQNKQKVIKQKQQQEPNLQQLDNVQKFAIILCHGGYFCLGVFDNTGCIYHKSDHRYVVRGKAGGRQLNKDSHSGSNIKSIGSQIRRAQEKKHQEKVNSILNESLPILQACQILFLQAPGINQQLLIQNEEPLFLLKDKIRSICLTAKKANYTEVERVYKSITSVYLIQKEESFFF